MGQDSEDKGFKVRDRRIFSPNGQIREERKDEGGAAGGEQRAQDQAESTQKKREVPLPEPSFSAFLTFFFFQQTLMFLGEIPHPETQKVEKNLPMAKYLIDTLAMLKEKTKGNLTEEEGRQLDAFLAELRMRYVKCVES
jgi:hypothetical protein